MRCGSPKQQKIRPPRAAGGEPLRPLEVAAGPEFDLGNRGERTGAPARHDERDAAGDPLCDTDWAQPRVVDTENAEPAAESDPARGLEPRAYRRACDVARGSGRRQRIPAAHVPIAREGPGAELDREVVPH